MNYRYVLRQLGIILLIGSLLMLIPTIMSFAAGDAARLGFAIAVALMAFLGFLLTRIHAKGAFYSSEGFATVALSWVLFSVFGCLPFLISGYISDFCSAFFEVVSGFTTTGISTLTDIEALPKSLLFWRNFTHWIGGMGILVFALAVMPKGDSRVMNIMKAEVAAPKVDKIVSSTRKTAQILYGLYFALSIIQIIVFLLGGLDLFDSLTMTFATAGTGGFTPYNASIASFNSVFVEVTCTVFMFLFSLNFNLFYLIVMGHFFKALANEEFRWFVGICAVSIIAVTCNIFTLYSSLAEAVRYSSFHVVSIISTTGFISCDYTMWPAFSQAILLILMFIGACTGSTGGGLKVGRIIILVKSAVREVRRLLNPSTVITVKLDKKTVDEAIVTGSQTLFTSYMLIVFASTLIISIDGLDILTNFSTVVSCINNIGPSLGNVVGAIGNASCFSGFSKIILSICMLAGRLNIFPVLMLFMPDAWKKASK